MARRTRGAGAGWASIVGQGGRPLTVGIVIGSFGVPGLRAAFLKVNGIGRWLALACLWLAMASGPAAQAQSSSEKPRDLEIGAAGNGLCGLVTLGMPRCAPETLTLAGTSGYAYTESLGRVRGAHHRIIGNFGLGYTPLPWLSLGVSLEGRIDKHPTDELGSNLTATGNPRLHIRSGHALPKDVTLGGELTLWVPGHNAPSFEFRATTLDLKTLLAWAPREQKFTLLTNVGFRLDNSATSAPDLTRTRAGDRIALGLSDSHAVLVGVGAAYEIRRNMLLFAEASADLLVGKKAPPSLLDSPLRVSVGGRYFFMERRLAAEVAVTGLMSARPGLKVSDPLVPTEPRILFTAGVRYNVWQKAEPPKEPEPPVVKEEAPPVVAQKTTETVSGLILDDTGAPLPEAVVKVVEEGAESERVVVTNGNGRYVLKDLPFGPVTLEASAVGFESQQWETNVFEAMPEEAPRTLVPQKAVGAFLRGLVRSFGSTPIIAQVTVTDRRGKQAARVTTDDQGRFEIELTPGKYRVLVKASGYKQHRVQVDIASGGVSILNVDMRQE